MSMEMPPCAYCGMPLATDAAFCTKCGNKKKPSKPMFSAPPTYDTRESGSLNSSSQYPSYPSTPQPNYPSMSQPSYPSIPQQPQPQAPPPGYGNYQNPSVIAYSNPQPQYNPYQQQGVILHQPPQEQIVHQVVHHHHVPTKSSGTAAMLELLPGFFFHTFGIGHMYAGNAGVGVAIMFGYWFVLFINVLLCFVFIGFITLPVCWIVTLVVSSTTASNAASRKQLYY